MKVPFLDLKAQYEPLRERIGVAIQDVLEKTAFAGGPFVEKFEAEFAEFCGADHCVAVNSGTTSLWFVLLGFGIGPGDEVITAANTFIATAEAITFTGATPVFVDVTPDTLTMDPALLEAAITPKTRAIMPVQLYGQPADMDPILEIARKHKLYVIEDAAQAHGSQYKGRPCGALADAASFSFYPGKNLGAYGEGGAVTTNNAELAQAMRILRDHGQSKKYHHVKVGWNGRMDGIQGAVLSVKLGELNGWNDARRRHAALYNELLADLPGLELPVESDDSRHIYHLYVVRTPHREALMQHLADRDIATGIHYPVPVPRAEAYADLGIAPGSHPVTEAAAEEILSLPMFPELAREQVQYVCDAVRSFCEQKVSASATA